MNRYFADLSNNNVQGVDFHAYRHKGGHVLVGLKATEGTTFVDVLHHVRAAAAHEHGVHVVHYHFGHPNANAEDQARRFWERVKPVWKRKDYLCLDIETSDGLGNSAIAAWIGRFVRAIKRLSGHSCVGYSYEGFLNGIGSVRIPGRRWWIAAYRSAPPKVGWIRRPWAWQFTDGSAGPQPHTVQGVGHCDISILNRASAAWLRLP